MNWSLTLMLLLQRRSPGYPRGWERIQEVLSQLAAVLNCSYLGGASPEREEAARPEESPETEGECGWRSSFRLLGNRTHRFCILKKKCSSFWSGEPKISRNQVLVSEGHLHQRSRRAALLSDGLMVGVRQLCSTQTWSRCSVQKQPLTSHYVCRLALSSWLLCTFEKRGARTKKKKNQGGGGVSLAMITDSIPINRKPLLLLEIKPLWWVEL